MKLRLLPLILLLTFPSLATAQEEGDGWLKRTARSVIRMPVTLSRVFDTTYVYKLDRNWVTSLDADLIWTGMQTRSDVGLAEAPEGSPQTHTAGHLRHNMFQKVGAGVSYGSLQLAYTVEVGKKSAERNKYTRFSFTRPHFGTSIQYYVINDYLDGSMTDDANPGVSTPFSSEYPVQLRSLIGDVFYFFSPDRLAYSAINGNYLIQRRSGGSWLLRACYTQGQLQYDLRDALVQDSRDHFGRYRSGEISLGGGYSYNWVPLHRAPAGHSTRGLRNLTLNATVVPGFTFYNHIHSTAYDYSSPTQPVEGKTVRGHIFGLPGLTLAARAGFSFSWERFLLCSTVSYNRSVYRGAESVNLDPQTRLRYRTQTHGSFYDVTARIQLCYRF
jgi:hypothetical protein